MSQQSWQMFDKVNILIYWGGNRNCYYLSGGQYDSKYKKSFNITKYLSTLMFIPALFLIMRNWNQPKKPNYRR